MPPSPSSVRLLRQLGALLVAIAVLIVAPPAHANDLADAQKAGEILWGGDQEGGGPYIYPKDDDPSQVTGFEVDLAVQLGKYLKVKPTFTQAQWDKLTDMLRADKVAFVLNGYEYTPERLDAFEATIPYYVYGLQLLLRKDDPVFKAWDDLKVPHDGDRAKIGVLTGSSAETHMREFCASDTPTPVCEVINYDGNTDTMREVETGKLDATLEDSPIAVYYLPQFPKLQAVGDPVSPGYYVMYVNKGETELKNALNEAIILMLRNGELEALYRRYGIWDKNQEQLAQIVEAGKFYGMEHAVTTEVKAAEMPTSEVVQQSARKHGFEVVTAYSGILIQSAGLTVVLSFLSFPLAIGIGLAVAVGRMYGPAIVRAPLSAYVELLRGTPLMLQLYFIFFILPDLGVNIPAFATGVIGLAINYSAYESEIYRAGLQAIPPGQMEAALSLGMSRAMAIRRIIVPQAVRIVIPPVMNDFIALFKDTSVCSVITLVELTKRFSVLSMSTQATLELMAMTAILYLGMSYPMSLIARRVEARMGV